MHRSPITVIIAAAFVALAPSIAAGDVSNRLPRLSQLVAEAQAAPPHLSYAAVRRVWQEWDQGDPIEIEDALTQIANAKAGAPRVYAQLLSAYARRRRGDLDGARKRVAELGFVNKWLVVGPFDNEGKGGFARPFGPEIDPDVLVGKSFEGKERKVAWRVSPVAGTYGWIDTSALVRPMDKVCVYMTAFVRDPALKAGSRTISIWAGSAGAVRVTWNGTPAFEDSKYRDFDSDRLAANVTLFPGTNRVLVKTCGEDGAPIFTLRFGGADGSPDPKIQVDPDASHAEEAKALWAKKPPLPAQTVEGPIQAFERMKKGNDPGTLDAYARYLVMTGGDDDSDHIARQHATTAAQKAPTILRALLAGDLSESRNQQAEWIEKAEKLINPQTPEHERMLVLLSRAAHARSGSNWRDAVPFYEEALKRDPDNVTAVLARVELYAQAGLRATSLAFLDAALARRPRSVSLLRAMVGSLRQENRTTEADEMENRYASFRADDTTFVRARIDLALAKRDNASALRWTDRLLALDPDSAEKLQSAARVHQTLGDKSRTIAMFKRALELAPEDTDTMRELADAYGLFGQDSDRVVLLRHILELKPQDKAVRDYLAHLEPSKPKPDELYALPPAEFLAGRNAPAQGFDRRTLVDLTVATVFPNGLSSKFHQVVFQPLTERAAQDGRAYAFGFEADSQVVQLRGVHVYRTTGEVDDTFDTDIGGADDPSIAMYTSMSTYRVRFPRLAPGDVVELQYRLEDVSERNAFADYFGDIDYMQSDEPVSLGEYVLITPKARTFYFNKPEITGITQTTEEKDDQRIFKFVAKNIVPMEPEPLQPPYTELLGHIHVSTYKTWSDMAKWYWGLVKDQFIADDEVRKRVAEITKGKKDEKEKVAAVYDYVVQKTRYVALEFGIHGFKPYKCSQIFARGYGDCKDKATLIVTMLKGLGIPATIVIVRTGMRGDFEDYPASLAPFDHAIAYVPSLDLYLDGTAEYTGMNELPAMDRGSLALQVNEGNPKLVHLPDPPASASVTSKVVEATLSPDGAAEIDWRIKVAGVYASSWRVRYHADAVRKDRMQEDIGSELPGIDISAVTANNLENVEVSPELKAKGKLATFARKEGTSLSVPIGPREHYVRDYTALSTRKRPIRLHAQTTTEHEYAIKLPAGMKASNIPQGASGTSPFGSFSVTVSTDGQTVRAKTTVVLTKTRIEVAEYGAFRAFCEQVDRALGQRITVTK